MHQQKSKSHSGGNITNNIITLGSPEATTARSSAELSNELQRIIPAESGGLKYEIFLDGACHMHGFD